MAYAVGINIDEIVLAVRQIGAGDDLHDRDLGQAVGGAAPGGEDMRIHARGKCQPANLASPGEPAIIGDGSDVVRWIYPNAVKYRFRPAA